MILKAIGENIQHLRKKKGMTQEQLAELVSLSPNHLSAIERGVYQLKYDKLAEIINCLECTPNDIFAGTYTSSYKTKASRLSDAIEKLNPDEQERIFEVVEVLVRTAK